MIDNPNDKRRLLDEKKRHLNEERERIERHLPDVITDSEVRNRMKNRLDEIDRELKKLDDQLKRL